MKKQRVVVVSSHALPHIGGIEILVDQEIRALANSQCRVVLITSDVDGQGDKPYYPETVRIIRVASTDFLERKFGFFCPIFSPRLISILFREISDCDVVHGHGSIALNTVCAMVIARILKKPAILTEHNGIQPRKTWLRTMVARLLAETLGRMSARLSTACITYNSRVFSDLKKIAGPRKKREFIPYAIDPRRFYPPTPEERTKARRALNWDDERKKVLFVGRLVAEKGIPLLLEASDARYDLVFCGAGDVSILGPLPRDGVEYLPPRPQSSLVQLYHAADLFILPSCVEGFPLVAREAIACGLKVILAYDPGYEPYRSLPNFSMCDRTATAIREAIHQAIDRPLQDPHNHPFNYSAQEWVERIYSVMDQSFSVIGPQDLDSRK